MNPNELICTVGLPYSGKSKWARSQHDCPIVSPDAIRWALFDKRFWATGEPLVWAHTWIMIRSMFLAGHHTVILDSTMVKVKQRSEAIQQGVPFEATEVSWTTAFKYISTDYKTCLKRAGEANDDYIIPVIAKMADQFEPLTANESLVDIGVV